MLPTILLIGASGVEPRDVEGCIDFISNSPEKDGFTDVSLMDTQIPGEIGHDPNEVSNFPTQKFPGMGSRIRE